MPERAPLAAPAAPAAPAAMNISSERVLTARDSRLRILIPLMVAIAFLMEQLDSTILTTAIPEMAHSLAIRPVRMDLAVSAYVLALAVFIPLSGWFADRFGARRIFILALAVFTLGSAFCGMATSFTMLVVMRVLQGLGGAMMTPVGRLIVLRSFPRRELVTAMTYVTLPAIFGQIIGPLLGGLLTTYASWRWIFYVNLPFGLAGMLLAARYMEEVTAETAERFDFTGFALFGGGLALLQAALESLGRSSVSAVWLMGLSLAAGLLLVAFVRYARRIAVPVVELGLFRERTFAVGTLAGGICRIAMNGTPFLLPLMLQVGFGMTPIASGLLTSLGSIGAIASKLFIGALLRRAGFRRMLVASSTLCSATLAGFVLLGPTTPLWLIGSQVVLFGLLRAMQFMTTNSLSYADVPSRQLSQATSLGGLLQQLTVSFGVSLSAMLLEILSKHDERLTPAHVHEVFLLTAVLPLIALPGFLRLRPQDGSQVSGHSALTRDGPPLRGL